MLTAVYTLLLLVAGSYLGEQLNPTYPELAKHYWEILSIRTTDTKQTDTTLPWWFFETTTPPNSCYYNGRIFFDGQEVYKEDETINNLVQRGSQLNLHFKGHSGVLLGHLPPFGFLRHQKGMCIYGAYCNSGLLLHFDGRFCVKDPPTPIPVTILSPPTIAPTDCIYHGKVYENYDVIEMFTPWPGCQITRKCHYGIRDVFTGCSTSSTRTPTPPTGPMPTTQRTPPTPTTGPTPATRGPSPTTEPTPPTRPSPTTGPTPPIRGHIPTTGPTPPTGPTPATRGPSPTTGPTPPTRTPARPKIVS